MNKKYIALFATAFVVLAGYGGYAIYNDYSGRIDGLPKAMKVQEELSETKKTLLGYTKYTDYIIESKKALEEQMKFLAAKVDREYVVVEHIQESKLRFTSNAAVKVTYAVEYSLGFDLKSGNYHISDSPEGITVTISKPSLVAAPAVKPLSHEILNKGILTDEKTAIIEIQRNLPERAQKDGLKIAEEEAVVALCEKKLIEFMRDFLMKKPDVKFVPVIKVKYT